MVTAVLLFAVLVTALCIFNATQANAEPSIALKLHKDFGYSSFGNDAQGNWTAQATVSEEVTRVEFYLDNLLQLNDTQAPFSWSYNTDNYAQGLHTIKAVAYDTNGNNATAEAQQNFVPFPMDFTIGIVLAVVLILIAAVVVCIVRIRRTKKRI